MVLLLPLGIGVALLALVLFPFVGLAMIPVLIGALVVAGAWIFVTATRGPGALPERRTPGEEK